MRKWIEWFAENPVAANLLMVVVMFAGLVSMRNLKQEVVPEIDADLILVTVPYPGATPSEVEKSICIKIEEAVEGLSGIKRITSTAVENSGTVSVELTTDANKMKLLGDITNKVDAIDTFPEDADEPLIRQIDLVREVIKIAVSGEVPAHALREHAERVRDDLAALPNVTKVTLAGTRPYEIAIEVSEPALRKYGLSFDEVAAAVRASSIDVPGGTVRSSSGQILLRSLGQAYEGPSFEHITLRSLPSGARVKLSDVAEVRDDFAETDTESFMDDRPAIFVNVFRSGQQSALDIAAAAHDYIARKQATLPEAIHLTPIADDARILRGRLNLLIDNGKVGFLLVLICLALFLKLRLALWVTIGIPLSFLGAFWLLPGLEVSVNLISLFGFILVLGIVVDDAIVIGENVYTHLQQGKTPLQAAKDGAKEVAVPVTFAVLTTVAAFSVMLGIEGQMGQFARNIPLVVIACLVFSVIEAFFILPAHLRHLKAETGKKRQGWSLVQGWFADGLQAWVSKVYHPCLEFFLRWRYATLAGAAATLIVSLGIVASGALKFTFFPEVDSDYIAVDLTMPRGTPKEVTAKAIRSFTDSAEKLRKELDGEEKRENGILRHVLSSVGSQPYMVAQQQNAGSVLGNQSYSHIGEVMVELAPSEDRSQGATEIVRRWRELSPAVPGAVEVSYTASLMRSGAAINVELTGATMRALLEGRKRLRAKLSSYTGVVDINDSFRNGKQEIRFRLTEAGEHLGLRQLDLARQIRQAYYGEEAQRVQRGRDDVPVMVRYPASSRSTLASLEELRVRTSSSDAIPLEDVAELSWGRGYAEIRRANRRRAIQVTADVDKTLANANEVMADLKTEFLPQLVKELPGLSYGFEGQQRQQREFMDAMSYRALLALVLIFALLAIPLKSYLQPLIIMSVIPFGIVGAIWGHIFMGMDLTMMSTIGLIALTGIVVNDSLVVVDFVNRKVRAGTEVLQAVREAGIARFRPILLTSLTTFAGLTPLLFEKSMQARFLIPAAVALAYGVVFATVITLVLVPCLYVVLDDMHRIRLRIFPGRAKSPPHGENVPTT